MKGGHSKAVLTGKGIYYKRKVDTMTATKTEIKRWTILDRRFNRINDVSDEFFARGLENHIIELRGQYIEVENGHKIWVDGIIKK